MEFTLNNNKYLGYNSSLDGLRAIAIFLVLLTHANFQLGSNGILGVDIFFALSGFLITTLLLEEFHKRRDISLKAFYVRRTFRLFPALYVVLFFTFLYSLFFAQTSFVPSIRNEIISSFFYVNNISWVLGLDNKGYILGHTWSLAVEEQFYLIWPFLLLYALYKKYLKLAAIILILFIFGILFLKISGNISSLGSALLHESIYIGCLAAIIRYLNIEIAIPDLLAIISLIFLLFIGIFPIKWYYDIYESGGRGIISLISSLVILSLLKFPQGYTYKLLSFSPLVFIGKISYSLYLWHVPVFRLFKYHSTLPPMLSFIFKFVVTFLLAIISFYFLEKKAIRFGRKLSDRIISNSLINN
jgi:peptidoglycan/LPS O-acetylase OafA/YrhL